MILFRCLACPAWRRLLSTPTPTTTTVSRTQTSSAVFSNIETTLTHNLLVFEYKDRILPFLAGIGLVQFIALGAVAYWSFYLFGTVTAKGENLTTDSTLLERAATIVPTTRFRYATNASIILLSASIFAACVIYPARCVRRLFLLKDGSSIGVVTFGFWPGTRKFTVPLHDVSASNALRSVNLFHKLSIRRRWFSYLLNRRDGKFLHSSTYETVIALKRF